MSFKLHSLSLAALLASTAAVAQTYNILPNDYLGNSATGHISCQIQPPYLLKETSNLNFGNLLPDSVAATALLGLNGVVSSGDANVKIFAGTSTAGVWQWSGPAAPTIGAIAATTVTSGSNPPMTVDTFLTAYTSGGTGPFTNNGTITVGATLHLNANQPSGQYSGTYTLVGTYQ